MKGKNLIIIILSMLVVLMGGYLVYDKVLNNDESNEPIINEDGNEINNQSNDIEKYKNKDGSYGIVKQFLNKNVFGENDSVTIELDINGTVYYSSKSPTGYADATLCEDVIDVIEFYESPGDPPIYFMLKNDGSVYKYNSSDVIGENWPVYKLDVSNVERIMEVNGLCNTEFCYWVVVAITETGQYINIANGSV